MTEVPSYDVALSFAGEDRHHAEALSKLLRAAGVRVFYDEAEEASLWGKDLYQHLGSVYGEQSRYCVVFVSEPYLAKMWTRHELKQAQARSMSIDREYILPVRIDDTALPGLPITIGYIDLRKVTIPQVALMLLDKLGRSPGGLDEFVDREAWDGGMLEYNGREMASYWPKQIERSQHEPVFLVTYPIDRVRYGSETFWNKDGLPPTAAHPCRDCGVLPGQVHVLSCCVEECPVCHSPALSCNCEHRTVGRSAAIAWAEGEDDDGV